MIVLLTVKQLTGLIPDEIASNPRHKGYAALVSYVITDIKILAKPSRDTSLSLS
jgi:hypothetical protein